MGKVTRCIPKTSKMCSPCGPMVCYKYEDCGPPLQCLPRSAFKRNGLQDCQFFQQGSIRYLCRTDGCCQKPCPCCPPCKLKSSFVYKFGQGPKNPPKAVDRKRTAQKKRMKKKIS
ncbi:unnamed protein product [Arctia plantaginis]|uniref:Uncharacterized protein n=1 Tax=Arctia plantaginis TaxID=874455 RepID=A0A8S0ZZ95_ARCPL|nr:unnamed protein product [Arctia plantaginis]